MEKGKYVECAKNFVINILNNNGNQTAEGLKEIFEIKRGNEQVLLEHLEAINKIIDKAIKELKTIDK